MQTRTIGTSELKVSTLGIGCNNFGGRLDQAASAAVVHAALDHGVTHFDTADVYPMGVGGMSEEFLGKGLGKRRGDVVVATKFGLSMGEGQRGGSRGYLIDAVEASLTRLGTDYIDLMYLHEPDPDTPIDETLRALDDLIHAGKIRHIGCSNMKAWQLTEAHFIAREIGSNSFIGTQEHYSMLARDVEAEVIPACAHFDLSLIPFFPLASGVLSGKYHAGQPVPAGTRLAKSQGLADMFMTEANLIAADKLSEFAQTLDLTLLDLAFAWLLANKTVPSVIAGASTPEQVARNVEAVDWELSEENIQAANAILAK